MIHIWRVKSNITEDSLPYNALKILSHTEALKADDFKCKINRSNFLVSRIALRKIISLYTKIQPYQVNYIYNSFGKPLINLPCDNLHFNLSHTTDNIVIALSKSPIGIDLEFINPKLNLSELAEYVFCKNENDKFQTLSTLKKRIYFYNIWTRKEALLKAIGIGMTVNFNQIDICNIKDDYIYSQWNIEPIKPFSKKLMGHLAFQSKYKISTKYYCLDLKTSV
jgi:4'-phosphopantetheinyl transferase